MGGAEQESLGGAGAVPGQKSLGEKLSAPILGILPYQRTNYMLAMFVTIS